MSFGIFGTHTGGRNLPGNAQNMRPGSGRPPSAKPTVNRNPITGEETQIEKATDKKKNEPSSTYSRVQGIPTLNLDYLQDTDYVSNPVVLKDYPLHTPGTASTVSWGTDFGSECSVRSTRTPKQMSSGRQTRPVGVPGLHLGDGDFSVREQSKKPPLPKEPGAWDKVPVPDNVPEPSARQKEMYKQYQDEMKQAYKAQSKPLAMQEADVEEAVNEYKKSYPKLSESVDEDDIIQKSWTKKQNYSKSQLMKKLDAEELLENNKKQKLIETVMVDQLARAVISAPEQNIRSPHVQTPDTRWAKGSNRSLHDSKVRTSSTATENLLSKRVQFGARVVTRNGHDATRELTGFFFHVDNTLTIYEFRQFGKSAKALPFIQRGKYPILSGPRKGEPYALIDIYPGATIVISSEKQPSLPDTLKKVKQITFKVTDLDQEEKERLLMPDVPMSQRDEVYTRLHIPNKTEYTDKVFLKNLQSSVQKKIKKRAIRTVPGLGRYYRKAVTPGQDCLYRFELEKGLFEFHIDLPPDALDTAFEILDPEEKGELDYQVYMKGVIGEMNEFRKSLVRKAFLKIDTGKKGYLTVSDIKKFFNATFQLSSRTGQEREVSAMEAFLEAVTSSSHQEEVSWVEFEEYYEGLSISIDDEEDFVTILRNTWTI
ncbi:hypothetical protein ACJMK2_028413 [Sinanodonta woodiana]|uniref:EF-hand domain-containing protein n=1 Tax=Sinanodonta woodiana TaxID=1069815 RepID=A0ABD3X996_SINWO